MTNMRKVHPHQAISGLSGLSVEDFWIWAYSDLLENTVRNAFAEFMVGFALGRLNKPRPGQESAGFLYRDKQVEVKTAAYTQNKPQAKKSKINFDITLKRKHTKPASTHISRPGALRPSDCYVFSLFTYENFSDKDAARNALMDTTHWRFYVVPTELIDSQLGHQKTVGVKWLEANCPDGATTFAELKRRIDHILGFKE